jgi:preprotein translocase subunit SecG
MLEILPVVGAVIDVVKGLIMVLFVLSTLLLMLVILIQEGKGGGITGVFGGGFTETFGVKAGTVNRFTAYLAAAFLLLALLHAGLSASQEGTTLKDYKTVPVPADGPPATPGTPPAATDPTPGEQPAPGEQPGGAPGTPPSTPPPSPAPEAPQQPPSPPAGENPAPPGSGGGEQPR